MKKFGRAFGGGQLKFKDNRDIMSLQSKNPRGKIRKSPQSFYLGQCTGFYYYPFATRTGTICPSSLDGSFVFL